MLQRAALAGPRCQSTRCCRWGAHQPDNCLREQTRHKLFKSKKQMIKCIMLRPATWWSHCSHTNWKSFKPVTLACWSSKNLCDMHKQIFPHQLQRTCHNQQKLAYNATMQSPPGIAQIYYLKHSTKMVALLHDRCPETCSA
jgi:hypothetical protein